MLILGLPSSDYVRSLKGGREGKGKKDCLPNNCNPFVSRLLLWELRQFRNHICAMDVDALGSDFKGQQTQ